jgi:2-polyprenyl-3-methyl-5-hydroxy-6-metoxy-1,4-benzoquinol methylase
VALAVKFTPIDPPRVFQTGRDEPIAIRDCGRIALEPDEQVTFVTESGSEYDVTRKAWGFYAAPSLNGRLLDYGLHAALARSLVGKYYLFLVQRGCEDAFADYLRREQNVLVRWLDSGEDLAAIPTASAEPRPTIDLHCMCGVDRFTSVHTYFTPPANEVRFAHTRGRYRREIFRCSICGHFVSVHQFEANAFYQGDYMSATYGGESGLRATFDRIASLSPERSDNAGRVAHVLAYAETHFGNGDPGKSVLDVGSGLCVFLHRMKDAGWTCTALDPDERAVAHARSHVGVEAIHGDFLRTAPQPAFHLVTLNKVLEHVKDPVAMLERARAFVKPDGLVYLEVPDGEAAAADSFEREEFFIEHHHVFSPASLALLAARAGLRANTLERVREPSTKYTLRAFCAPA